MEAKYACFECHTSKSFCEKSFPCGRCIRLGKDCRAHKRAADDLIGKERGKRRKKNLPTTFKQLVTTEMNSVLAKKRALDNHFGLQCALRILMFSALKSGSFDLLAQASSFALKLSIEMQSMISITDEPFGLPRNKICSSTRLSWTDIPRDLLLATGHRPGPKQLGDRWIHIHSTKLGVTSDFLSPAFERDIMSFEVLRSQAESQKPPVPYISQSSRPSFVRVLVRQILAHDEPGKRPKSSQASGISIQTGKDVAVKSVFCVLPISRDHIMIYTEYIPKLASPPSSSQMPVPAIQQLPLPTNSNVPQVLGFLLPVHILHDGNTLQHSKFSNSLSLASQAPSSMPIQSLPSGGETQMPFESFGLDTSLGFASQLHESWFCEDETLF